MIGPDSYPVPSSRAASKVMRANKRTDTKPEMRVRSYLHRSGLRFRKDYLIRSGDNRVRADVAFAKQRVAVFVDGCFWHSCPFHGTDPKSNSAYWTAKLQLNVERDQRTNRWLKDAGWHVVRIWEHEPPEIAARAVIARLNYAGEGR